MKRLFFLIAFVLTFIMIPTFADIEDSYSFERDIFINGVNCTEMEAFENIISGDDFIYFPLDIDFLGSIGVFPMWNENFNKMYIKSSSNIFIPKALGEAKSGGHIDSTTYEKKNIEVFIDGQSKNLEAIFNSTNNLYYAPVDDFVINKLGWRYYDYGVGGKYLYTYEPSDEEFAMMNENLEYYNSLATKMMEINRQLERNEANYYIELIKNASSKYEIDEIWIAAMIWQESNFEKDCEYKGATGLLQMMVSTGKNMGLTREDLLDPETNIDSCIKYLRNHINYYDGDLEKATLAYNQGTVRVDRGQSKTWYIEQVKAKYGKLVNYVEKSRGEESEAS